MSRRCQPSSLDREGQLPGQVTTLAPSCPAARAARPGCGLSAAPAPIPAAATLSPRSAPSSSASQFGAPAQLSGARSRRLSFRSASSSCRSTAFSASTTACSDDTSSRCCSPAAPGSSDISGKHAQPALQLQAPHSHGAPP